MNDRILTIFTPTYNRENTITNAYNSLVNQTCKNFIWLIVDDGSTDNTELLIKKFINEKKINIKYYKKKNGGKHSAINYGLDKVFTEYIYLSLDSDDVLFSNTTVEIICKQLEKVKENEVGIITLCTTSKTGDMNLNNFIRYYDIEKIKKLTLAEAYKTNQFNAECRMILKTNYLRNFKFPEIPNENFFTEAYVYWQMDEKVIWTTLNTCYSEYLSDGLTANIFNLFLKNPTSWYMYNELRLKNTKVLYLKLKYYIYYISFAILSKNKIFKKDINYILIILLFPISILGILYLKMKRRTI